MENVEEFLDQKIESLEQKLAKTTKSLDTYKSLLKEFHNGTLTSGDVKVILRGVSRLNKIYPFYKEVMNNYRIYSLTKGE